MAVITIKYNIKIGDWVLFTNDSKQIIGTVQDISELPELWVETGDAKDNTLIVQLRPQGVGDV